MNILNYLDSKEPFTIRTAAINKLSPGIGRFYNRNVKAREEEVTQDDFLDELYNTSHNIHCFDFKSHRQRLIMDEKGEARYEFQDYHKSSLSWQYYIRRTKASIAGGNDPKFFNESKGPVADKILQQIRTKWDTTGLTYALHNMFTSLYGTADAAVVEYYRASDRQIIKKVFSYENGDELNFVKNPFNPYDNGVGVRGFWYEGLHFIELWTDKDVQIWVDDTNCNRTGENKHGYEALGLKKVGRNGRSEDGWVRVFQENHGMGINPFTYVRRKGPVWQPAQTVIEDLEGQLSDIIESGKLFFHPILFGDSPIISAPAIDNLHKFFGAKEKGAKMEFLQPPQISSAFEFTYNKLIREIMDSTSTVLLHPEELKGQNDSASYLQLLYWPETQYAESVYAEIHEQLDHIFQVHKKCVGLAVGNDSDYSSFEFTWELTPRIPENDATKADTLTRLVGAGLKSKETAIEEVITNTPHEKQRIKREKEEEVEQTAALEQATQPGTTELVVGESE